jgi:hypothetical protein
MKKTKILSLGLAALLGIGVFSAAIVTSTQRDNCLEVNAASLTDSISPETTLSKTSSGRFSWNRKMTGTTTQVWDGAVYSSFANNATFTLTWTVPDGYQVRKVRPFYNILCTTDWKDTYKLKSTVTCGDYSVSNEDTIAHYPVLRLTDSGKTPQHANVTFTIKNTSGNTGYLAFDTSEIFEVEYEIMTATVTLNKQSGTGGSDSFSVKYGNNMPNVTVPTRANYRFEGYYDAVSGGKKYINADGTSASTWDKSVTSATLYARWTLMQFDVTLNQQGGTGGTELVQATYGQAMPSATMPTKTGYTFEGYFDALTNGKKYYNADGTSASTWDKTSTSTLYAKWSANEYKATFDSAPGTGGLTELDIHYDEELPDLTAEQIPSLAPSGNHSYSFGGYFTEQPTPNGDGSYTPNGKQYYDKDGKGIEAWHEASDTTLYAYYTVDMEVSSSGYSGTWDGENHGISVNVNFPEGTTTYYGDSASSCNNPNASDFLKSGAGTYDIYYEVRLVGYTPFPGHETIIINKDESIIDPRPSAVIGLEYTALDQELVVAGEVDYGNMLYAVNTTGELPADSEFSANIPTGKLVDTYYVFYKSSGDGNHNPYAVVETEVITIEIARVDRTKISNLNDVVLAYLDTINERYPGIAATLEAVRAEVYQDAIVEDNITVEGVNQNIIKLQEALSAAKVDVTEALIEAIGTVSYPNSKDAIEEAKDYFDNVLNEEEKVAVNATLVETLNKDDKDYNDAKTVADLINAIPEPSDTDEYYKAVEDAKAAYDNLASSNPDAYALVNGATDKEYETILENNVEAKEVIELIDAIGELTYNGGTNDSLADIESAEAAYEALASSNPDALALVNKANHDDLVEARESYDDVDETVKLIAAIGEIVHGGEDDSKEDLVAAREAYDALSEEEKALVNGYENSYKVLDDDEHVYTALEYIDGIGTVSYDSESEEKINQAREYYDSLTEDQKAQLGENPLTVLTDAEELYASQKQTGIVWNIILFILIGILLALGIFVMIKLLKKKDDDKKNGTPTKAMSVVPVLPFVILISGYLSTPYIIFYVIAGLTILVWLTDLVIYLVKKYQKAHPNAVNNEVNDEEVVEITDEKGNVFQIRYIKSFTAKLIQSPEETKKYYEELKNEVLSYKKTNSRVSWHYDAVNSGREYVLKFAIRGKTLCVYLPLDPEKVEEKYKVEKSESKRFEEVPCLYRIKNDRRLGYAKELIAVVTEKLGLEKGEEQHEVYSNLPYEPNKPLIARGLIKEQKVQINKPSEVVIDTKVDEEGDEIVTTVDNFGQQYEIRYLKSFTAKLSQTDDEIKDFYNELKNYALSFKESSSRVSWNYDSINVGRKPALKFVMKRKNLAIYYALDTSKIGQKYKVEHVEYKKYEDVPCMYLIINEKRKELAKALIDRIMRYYKCEKGEELNDEYRVPFESKETLIKKGLIREVRTRK